MEDVPWGIVRLGMPCSERPESNDLQRFLTHYCKLWRGVGLKLGLISAVLDEVASAYPADNRECFRVTLEKWSQLNVGVTWGNLELAITNANRESLGLQPLPTMPICNTEETANQPDVNDGERLEENNSNATSDVVVKKQFRPFRLMKLREQYSRVVRRLIHIFREKKIDIEELITILRFDDAEKNTIFSTDSVFNTINTEIKLFQSVALYCKGIYDYQVLVILVQASQCQEAIKELDDFTKMLQNSILAEIDLISDHGELLHPDDFMSGTYKFIIEYRGGKCTVGTKEMIQNIVEQSVNLKRGILIFRGFDIGSCLLIYQISEVVKKYLLDYRFTKQDLAFLEGNNITNLIVDGTEIMRLNKVRIKLDFLESASVASSSSGYSSTSGYSPLSQRYKIFRPMFGESRPFITSRSALSVPSIYSSSSKCSSMSLQSGFHKQYTFKFRELRRFLSIITNQIDLPAVALILASNEVIELHLAQELLQFTGGVREKGVKVLEIFNQLQRQEDRVPFFLKSLLDSGENSPTNRELYERLSSEINFCDSDVEDACKNEVRRRSLGRKILKMEKSSASSASSEYIETSTSSIRKPSSPHPYMSENIFGYDIPAAANPPHPSANSLTTLQEENAWLQQEVERLHKMLEWSFNLNAETQRNLVIAKSQLSALYHTKQFGRSKSTKISPSTQTTQSKIRTSRSLDSIPHELMKLQLEEQATTEMPTVKSPSRSHAKTMYL